MKENDQKMNDWKKISSKLENLFLFRKCEFSKIREIRTFSKSVKIKCILLYSFYT